MWFHRPAVFLLTLAALASGACAARTGRVAAAPQVPAAAPVVAAQPASPPAPVASPLHTLLAASDAAATLAEAQFSEGNFESARAGFNEALDILLSAAPALRDQVEVQTAVERLIARISTLELESRGDLAQADSAEDGTTLDRLLATPTLGPPMEATAEAVADDLATTTHDIDIPLNARVLSYVELFTGRLRSFLEESLNRGARFLPMIQDALRAEGLPTDLAFVPVVESAFNPNAMSRAKARGLWQFMRGTAVENGLRHDWYMDERAEPGPATVAAVRYLKSLYRTFGDWHLALASYNGGPGRLQKAMKRSGKTDFWTLSATSRYLPRETRDYVPLILAAVIVARNPTQYGLTLMPTAESAAFETVAVPSPVDLRRLSEAIGHPMSAIQALNPALRRWVTPPRTDTFQLRVPEGTADAAAAYVATSTGGDVTPFVWHTARKGETLASIARTLKVTRLDLAEANFLSLRARVTSGTRLVVPRPPGTVAPVPDERASVRQTAAAPRRSATASAVHRVRKGDTLGSIARRYRTTVADIRRWNRLTGHVIRPGDQLTIRQPHDAPTYN
ncbi:MAG: transglycosylase SLT domain-containing protein [Vicinamibacterales bacterium]